MLRSPFPPLPEADQRPADRTPPALFGTAVPPEAAVLHEDWRTAFTEVDAALKGTGIVALVGAPGLGKTLLLQVLRQRMQEAGLVATLLRTGRDPGAGTPDVILIDDADRVGAPMLQALVRHHRPIVAAGPPDLVDRLRHAGLAVTAVVLAPLRPDAAREFLSVQIARGGPMANPIESAAVTRLIEDSAGVPRDLQLLAGLSVFLARLAASPTVTRAHVEQAGLIHFGTDPDPEFDEEEEAPAAARPRPDPQPGVPRAAAAPSSGLRRTGSAAFVVLAIAGIGWWQIRPAGGPLPVLQLPAPPTSVLPAPVPVSPAPPPAAPLAKVAPEPAPIAMPASPPPLPPVQPIHLVLSFDPTVHGADAAASALAAELGRLAYPPAETEPGPVRERDGVYYVFAEDAAPASVLARRIGRAAMQARAVGWPRPGTLRVVVNPAPDPPPKPQPRPQPRSQPQSQGAFR